MFLVELESNSFNLLYNALSDSGVESIGVIKNEVHLRYAVGRYVRIVYTFRNEVLANIFNDMLLRFFESKSSGKIKIAGLIMETYVERGTSRCIRD